MAQVLNGLRSGSKDEVLTSAHQRHTQCPTYILAIFSRNAKRYEKKDADLPGSPPVKKEKKEKKDKRDSKSESVKTKKRKGGQDESPVAEVPKSKKSKKNKWCFDSSWSFFDLWAGLPIYRAIMFVGTPNKFVSPEGTCRSPATDMKQDSTCGTCVQFWTHPCPCLVAPPRPIHLLICFGHSTYCELMWICFWHFICERTGCDVYTNNASHLGFDIDRAEKWFQSCWMHSANTLLNLSCQAPNPCIYIGEIV